MMNRHHQSRRSGSSIAPKIEPGVSPLPPPINVHPSAASPKSRPTPSSHTNSPTSAGPAFGSQPAVSPATSDHAVLRATMAPTSMAPAIPQRNPMAPINPAARAAMMAQQPPGVRVGSSGPFYPTPSFQNHIEQLGKFAHFLSPLFYRTLFVLGLFREYRAGVRCSRNDRRLRTRYPERTGSVSSIYCRCTATDDDVPHKCRTDASTACAWRTTATWAAVPIHDPAT
jgi:hypothetical protein